MTVLASSPDRSAASRETARSAWCGLLSIDKPAGLTSHDVVDRVRRRLAIGTAGHLGTLDPSATGLLLIATGPATRCIPVWQGGAKTYEGTVLFGEVTHTQDVSGEVLERHAVTFDEAAVREASSAFLGAIDQIPPMVSALKVGGERLYRLARRGVEVERAPRRVHVFEWDWLSFELPRARFRVRCSSGTYVRTLVHDLGRRLGAGGTLAQLRRLRSEPFALDRAITMGELETLSGAEAIARAGTPLEQALALVPRLDLDPAGAEAVGHGRAASVARAAAWSDPPAVPGASAIGCGPRSVAFFAGDGRVLALGELLPDPHDPERLLACPHVVFPWAVLAGGR